MNLYQLIKRDSRYYYFNNEVGEVVKSPIHCYNADKISMPDICSFALSLQDYLLKFGDYVFVKVNKNLISEILTLCIKQHQTIIARNFCTATVFDANDTVSNIDALFFFANNRTIFVAILSDKVLLSFLKHLIFLVKFLHYHNVVLKEQYHHIKCYRLQ